MKALKQKHLDYLSQLSDAKMHLTKVVNEEEKIIVSNHRNTSGINIHNKAFCYTPVVDEYSGVELTDIDGNHYIDLSMGFGVHLLGHHPAVVKDSIAAANRASWGLGPMNSMMFRYAKGIRKLTGVDRLAFFNTGTEAVSVAMRIARAFSGKDKIVLFKGAYHGHNDSTLVFKTDPMSNQPLPLIPGIPSSTQADIYLLDYDADSSLDFIARHADEIAAVMVEPVQSRNPSCQPAGFLKSLRKLTAASNIALIFDEMITGFRIHPGGAQAYFGIKADIVTYGKIIGGGMPIGIVAGKSDYIDLIDGGVWKYGDDSLPKPKKTFVAGTFCNHPLSMAAGNAVVNILLEKGNEIISRLNQTTENMVTELNEWMKQNQVRVELTAFGSMFRINVPSNARIFFHQLLLEGIYIWEGKTCFLSTAHTEAHIEKIKACIKKSALLLKACSYFPTTSTEKIRALEPGTLLAKYSMDRALNTSMNFGVSLNIKGNMDPDLLEIAIRYVTACEPEFRSVSLNSLVRKQNCTSTREADESLQEFINLDILDEGLASLLIFTAGRLSHFAVSGHRTRIDGWSLSILLIRIIDTYKGLSAGIILRSIGKERTELIVPELSKHSAGDHRVSRASKFSFTLNHSYALLKKIARKKNYTPLQYLKSVFVMAYKRNISENTRTLTLGTPVTGQMKYGSIRKIGAYTFLQVEKFKLDEINEWSDCMEHGSHAPAQAVSCVVNIDRYLGDLNHKDFALSPAILDPDFIRFDIVMNALSTRGEDIRIDIKWRRDQFSELAIQNLIADINSSMSLYATARSKQS